MERNALHLNMAEAFAEESFLRQLDRSRTDMTRLFSNVDWERLLYSLLPMEQRLTCAQVLTAFRPLQNEYIYLPLTVHTKTYSNCTINKNKNQIFCSNFSKKGVMHYE